MYLLIIIIHYIYR